MLLPKGLSLSLLQTKWASLIDPFLSNPSLSSIILPDISLVSGSNSINHTLGRKLLGWRVIRIQGSATLYDQQGSNPMPELTLVLVSNANVVVSLEVF